MSLYPSLEDMKVDHIQKTVQQIGQDEAYARMLHSQEMSGAASGHPASSTAAAPYPVQPAAPSAPSSVGSGLYPSLEDYMGLDLSAAAHQANLAVVPAQQYQVPAVPASSQVSTMVAPISEQNAIGIQRAEIKQGLRLLVLCKNAKGLVGMRIKSVSKGIFVAHVTKDSPSAMAGLRFGDQILEINNETVAGYSTDKVHKMLKKADPQRIEVAVRDRPFERTVTLQKNSNNQVGFIYKNGKITSIVKDSSAARNGLLIDHQLCEVNGQCVIGMKDKDVLTLMQNGGHTVTITIMPTFVYEHIVKSVGSSLMKNQDHSIPEV